MTESLLLVIVALILVIVTSLVALLAPATCHAQGETRHRSHTGSPSMSMLTLHAWAHLAGTLQACLATLCLASDAD